MREGDSVVEDCEGDMRFPGSSCADESDVPEAVGYGGDLCIGVTFTLSWVIALIVTEHDVAV